MSGHPFISPRRKATLVVGQARTAVTAKFDSFCVVCKKPIKKGEDQIVRIFSRPARWVHDGECLKGAVNK